MRCHPTNDFFLCVASSKGSPSSDGHGDAPNGGAAAGERSFTGRARRFSAEGLQCMLPGQRKRIASFCGADGGGAAAAKGVSRLGSAVAAVSKLRKASTMGSLGDMSMPHERPGSRHASCSAVHPMPPDGAGCGSYLQAMEKIAKSERLLELQVCAAIPLMSSSYALPSH